MLGLAWIWIFGVDLEVALRHHQFALRQTVANEVEVAGTRTQHDLAALRRSAGRQGKSLAQLGHDRFDLGMHLLGLLFRRSPLARQRLGGQVDRRNCSTTAWRTCVPGWSYGRSSIVP